MATIKPKAELDNEGTETGFEPLEHPGHLIRRLHQISVSVFLDKASEYGITHVQFAALQAIDFAPGIDQGRLGKLIAIDRQTTSNVTNRLEEKGMIERRKKDKRTNSLFLTKMARPLLEVMMQHIPAIDETILSPLHEDERQVFLAMLRKLVNSNNELSRAPLDKNNLPKRSSGVRSFKKT